ATLADGSCGNSGGNWTAVTLDNGADTTVQSGHCYRYRYTISDNVGNASAPSAASADAKVTTNAPTVNVTAPTAVTGAANQSYDAATKTLWFRPSGSGSFALNATAGEADAAIDHVGFPDLSAMSGWSGSTGGDDATSPY